ncbi:MAG: hypothetical protein R2860_12000 [Desulfobacterales bacterium]
MGVIEITGVIADSVKSLNSSGRSGKTVRSTIVVRIDLPGGGVGPSQKSTGKSAKTVRRLRSGGLPHPAGITWWQRPTGRANPGTITGGIGVILGYTNFEQLFQNRAAAGGGEKREYKDIASPVREMTDAEKRFSRTFPTLFTPSDRSCNDARICPRKQFVKLQMAVFFRPDRKRPAAH